MGEKQRANGAMQEPNSAINRHIGSRLLMLRKKLRLSQTEFASILGVTYQQQQKYEKGSVRVSAAALLLIASRLQVGIDYFFDGLTIETETMGFAEPSAHYDAGAATTSDAERLDRAFARLRSRTARAQAIALVELVANNFEDAKAGG